MTRYLALYTAAALAVCAAAVLTGVGTVLAQPEVTERNLEDGDVVDAPPEVIHMCFSEAVNNDDITATPGPGAPELPWQFSLTMPDGIALGLRIVFEPDGSCVDVHPGLPEEPQDGIWTFDWLVRSRETNEAASGLVAFRVGEGEAPEEPGSSSGDDDDDISTSLIIGAGVGLAAAVVVTGLLVVTTRRRARQRQD